MCVVIKRKETHFQDRREVEPTITARRSRALADRKRDRGMIGPPSRF